MVEFNFKLDTCNRLHMKAAARFFNTLSDGDNVERFTEKVKTPDEIHAENVEADEYNNRNKGSEAPKDETPTKEEPKEEPKDESGEAPKAETPVKKKRKRRTKAQIEADRLAAEKAKEEPKDETPTEEPKDETPTEEPKDETPTEEPKDESGEAPTKQDVREALSTKIGTHRDEIVKKFKSFGAKNISTLKEEYYAEFIEFIEKLGTDSDDIPF